MEDNIKSKKLLIINSVLGFGSTGRIVLDMAKRYELNGFEVKIGYGRGGIPSDAKKYGVRIGCIASVFLHVLYTRLTDKHGLASKLSTKKFLEWAEKYNPDVLWIHNIHGYYINYKMLFDWIKARPNMIVKWTLHDCWAFTGHCAYFTRANCNMWKYKCSNCLQLNQYPKAFIDRSKKNYECKKKSFTGVKNLTIIVPSKWLANLVNQSFLSDYAISVHHNSVNKEIFKPVRTDFKYRHGIFEKKMVLGVANVWENRKGLKIFLELYRELVKLGKEEHFQIVLVGLNKLQIFAIKIRGYKILALPRTNDAASLAEIYSAADIFVNPSCEETYGLTTAEAQACGTFSIVYENTACAEILDRDNGVIVSPGVFSIEKNLF